ncbi:molybdopterin-dependent oxidoreductase [Salinilacihabitans rarus]|uniref:molybdopterin-dependent oxidoreductase n=1 Tax=Salinilacihabitans rarus TaxID=2961596 RepID=UPI0020C8F58A|nr:molybdopterin-dependent oxidoreductase [Salinilacihabitans rarus]
MSTAERAGALPEPITVVGADRVAVTDEDLASLPTVTRTVDVDCATGSSHVAAWTGVPVAALLDLADPPGETTHLAVEAGDGYRVCVDVLAALDGVLALVHDGVPIADTESYATRFVAPDVSGTRSAKGVARMETLVLSPSDDPEAFETVGEEPFVPEA